MHSAAPALRETVLSGEFFGGGPATAAVAAFPFASDGEALRMWFGAAFQRVAAGTTTLRTMLDRDIAGLDAMIGTQLDAILHNRRLLELEGRWRGVAWLLAGLPSGARVKVRLLTIAWSELCRDLERAVEFDQSQLFRKIYEEEFGTPGGEPFGLLVVDHQVRHRPAADAPTDDVSALTSLAAVAAAAFAPAVVSASPALLGIDGFGALAGVMDPVAPLDDDDHTRWRTIGNKEDSRFLAVVLPRALARLPWRDDPERADGFRYEECVPGTEQRVWMSAGFAFAAITARAFAESGWPAGIRGVDCDRIGGGLVTGLPAEPFSVIPEVARRNAVEVALTDRQERALVAAGLIPLSALPFCSEAMFSAVPSLQMPLRLNGAAGTANARLSAQINAMLCACRFAHHIKLLGRQTVGSFRTAEEVERRLQSWLERFVNANSDAGPETRARFPLAGGRVTVRDQPGRPGVLGCTLLLQPHYQLDGVTATFRLATEIAAPGVH